MNAKFDLKIYLLNPGDEIFAPMNIWPKTPQEQRLSKMNEYVQIRLTKESKLLNKKEKCNSSHTYVYGGKKFQRIYR